MIISRAPMRASLMGGSSDVPSWLSQGNKGKVLGMALQQYSFITARYLPPYLNHKIRLAYSKTELVDSVDDIEHNVIRCALQYLGMDGVEITHMGDVPSYSGLGSSSTFLVSLVLALASLKGMNPTKNDLFKWCVDIEQNWLKENVGYQDTAWAVYGNCGVLNFDGNTFSQNIIKEDLSVLESHILLFYTKIQRTSSKMAEKYYGQLPNKNKEMTEMLNLTSRAVISLEDRDYTQVGALMSKNWNLKKSFHPDISNEFIDGKIEDVRKCGGFAKLTGAGSGGCILVISHPSNHKAIRDKLKDLVEIPVKIDKEGAKVVYRA